MKLLGSSFFTTTADRPSSPEGGRGAGPIVLWLRDEHEANALRASVEAPAEGYPRTKVPEGGGRLARSGW
jgi:hypothetical protein